MSKEDKKWISVESDDYIVIMPDLDSDVHSNEVTTNLKTGEKTAELAQSDCPCNPTIVSGDEKGLYEKPMIIHNAFDGRK